jgi:hypothetical protein
VFQVEDVSVVVGEGPDELLVIAAKACPASAMVIVDDATGEGRHR